MDRSDGVVIYDGDCPFCSAVASVLRRLEGVGVVPWDAPAARTFLAAQFEDVPFALAFVDPSEEQVYVGEEAARVLTERTGLPALAADLVGRNYESTADAIRTISGLDREPDPYHDVCPLTPDARERYDALEERAERPSRALDHVSVDG